MKMLLHCIECAPLIVIALALTANWHREFSWTKRMSKYKD